MCFYCKAASEILDSIWEEPAIRAYFSNLGADLTTLGPQVHAVFVPAYRKVKRSLDRNALALLEAQVTQDLLTPFYDQPRFRQVWDEWDQPTREAFIREQSEAQLARLILTFHADEFIAVYQAAYAAYIKDNVAQV